MRSPDVKIDRFGREAFAYLAISILVLTTFYVSYEISLERGWEKGLRDRSLLLDLKGELNGVKWGIGQYLIALNDEFVIRAGTEVLRDPMDKRLDGRVESMLIERLNLELAGIANSFLPPDSSFNIEILNWTVDSIPVTGDLEIPVPGTRMDRNLSGLTETCMGSEVFGVNTTFHIEMVMTDSESSLIVMDDLEISVNRVSLSEFVTGRIQRFQDAVNGMELASLLEYMVGLLVQTKCMMGFGREPGTGEIVPISIVTEAELLSVLDLAMALLARSHLMVDDRGFIESIGEDLSMAPGGSKRTILPEYIESSQTVLDPGALVLGGEGIFHQDNPPDLQMVLRPFFLAIVDTVVNKLVSYLGVDDMLMGSVGRLKTIFDLGAEAVDSLSESILGMDLIDTSRSSAKDIFRSMLERSCYLDPEEYTIMIRKNEEVIWNGSSISSYPLVRLPQMERSFELGLSDGGPENQFYRSPNGTVHSKAEYFDPTEEFLGVLCTIYRIKANFIFDEIEPPFIPRNLLEDEEFINALAYFLGTDESDTGSGSESEFREKGRYAVRKVTESFFNGITGPFNEIWKSSWKGWTDEDIPSFSDGLPPLGSMMDIGSWPIKELADSFATALIDEFSVVGLFESLCDVEGEYTELIADWIFTNYDIWTHRGDQIGYIQMIRKDLIFDHTDVEILEVTPVEENVLENDIYLETGKNEVSVISERPEISKWLGLGLAEKLEIDVELEFHWSSLISASYLEVRDREFGTGSDGRGEGWIRNELKGQGTRGFDLLFSSYNGDPLSISNMVEGLVSEGFDSIGCFNDASTRISGGRFLLPATDLGGRIEVHDLNPGTGSIDNLTAVLAIQRNPSSRATIEPTDGTYNTDISNASAPYRTIYSVYFWGEYTVRFSVSSGDNGTSSNISRILPVYTRLSCQVASYWPMFGAQYEKVGRLIDHLKDKVVEARDTLKGELNRIVEDVLGDSMSSLREVPPIIIDIVKGNDLDIAEIARVASNITMDLSSTLRETVKGIVTKIAGLGVKGILNLTCAILGIEKIDLELDIGTLKVALHTERKALTGGPGSLLNITFDLSSIGMHCCMSFNRLEDGNYDFHGTATFDVGPLWLRLEMDPFMLRAPHMISIEVRYDAGNGKVLRASLECPALEEYRSCQVSLGDTLGVEPFIPIPPLGIQAVIDAGFMMRYRMPEELGPQLNEIRISGRNITEVEIFNPRGYPLYGSTLEIEGRKGSLIISWKLDPENSRFIMAGMKVSNLWRCDGPVPSNGMVRVVLRSPSGLILDDLDANLSKSGWFSRDADGYGVWRYGEGTPGSRNGGSLPTDIKSLLISIALSAVKEAWKLSYEVHGLSFDIIVPFLEKAIDLFMERFLSVVRELVVDVRMFLSLEIEDASGTAGGGLELSFLADGEAVAEFLGWLYENIKVFISNLADPRSAGDYRAFPMEILARCYIGLDLFMEVEMPVPIAKMAPKGVDLPDSFTLAIMGRVNLALPLKLLGVDVGGIAIVLGIYIKDAPDAIVSLFYDVGNIGLTQDFYLLRGTVWEESIEVI
ncbi:MAG: hypothetical protein ACMUHM_00365 [Thermoplasmatota archaeon]